MLPVHTCGMATDMNVNVIQSRGTAADQEAVIVTESAREEVCHTICLAILLLSGILMMSNFRHQDLCMLGATRADAAHV